MNFISIVICKYNFFKLFININTNSEEIKGKYTCPLFGFIWFITMLITVAYIDSRSIDHLFETILLWLVDKMPTAKAIRIPIVK